MLFEPLSAGRNAFGLPVSARCAPAHGTNLASNWQQWHACVSGGYKVIEARGSEEAMVIFGSDARVDAVLFEVQLLCDMDGFGL